MRNIAGIPLMSALGLFSNHSRSARKKDRYEMQICLRIWDFDKKKSS